MPGVYSTYGIYLPTDFLVWLSSSTFRLVVYRLQEFHALFRIAHILALRQFAPHVLPWTYASFCGATMARALSNSAWKAFILASLLIDGTASRRAISVAP
jgi:hypothetical protein